MGQRFIALDTFEADINGHHNRYLRGQTYTVHDTPNHKDLGKKVQIWAKEGKVMITGTTVGKSIPEVITTSR